MVEMMWQWRGKKIIDKFSNGNVEMNGRDDVAITWQKNNRQCELRYLFLDIEVDIAKERHVSILELLISFF